MRNQFTLTDGISTLRQLEPDIYKDLGAHLALGGSLAYRGTSTKDIDIIIYPHSRERPVDRVKLLAWLEIRGFTPDNFAAWQEYANLTDVLVTTHTDGRRVDFFIMDRAPFHPTQEEASQWT